MPKKVDANQPNIVKALRDCGCKVEILSDIGKGCPDLLVGWHGLLFVLEIKDGDKPLSKQALTPDEAEWHIKWKDERVYILNDIAKIPSLLSRVEADYEKVMR